MRYTEIDIHSEWNEFMEKIDVSNQIEFYSRSGLSVIIEMRIY